MRKVKMAGKSLATSAGLTGREKDGGGWGGGGGGGGSHSQDDEHGEGDTTQALVFSLLALAPFYMAQAIPLCSGIVSTIVSAVLMDNYAINQFDKATRVRTRFVLSCFATLFENAIL